MCVKNIFFRSLLQIAMKMMHGGMILFLFYAVLLAWLIPNLGLFITLVGALCTSVLGLMLPPLFSICVHWEKGYGTGYWKLWKDITIIFIGMVGCVTGTYISLIDIAKEYSI